MVKARSQLGQVRSGLSQVTSFSLLPSTATLTQPVADIKARDRHTERVDRDWEYLGESPPASTGGDITRVAVHYPHNTTAAPVRSITAPPARIWTGPPPPRADIAGRRPYRADRETEQTDPPWRRTKQTRRRTEQTRPEDGPHRPDRPDQETDRTDQTWTGEADTKRG